MRNGILRILVAAVVGTHFLYFFAVLASFPLVIAHDWYRPVAVALVALMGFSARVFSGECPLTHWERTLRFQIAKRIPYHGACVAHYANQLLRLRLTSQRVRVINTSVGVAFVLLSMVMALTQA